VDATIAECIEDTFAAGYTEDHLVKLLSEAASYVPPGMSIQAMGCGGDSLTGGDRPGASCNVTQLQQPQRLQLPGATSVWSGLAPQHSVAAGMPFGLEPGNIVPNPVGLLPPGHFSAPPGHAPFISGLMTMSSAPGGVAVPMPVMSGVAATSLTLQGLPQQGPALPPGVPPPPGLLTGSMARVNPDEGEGFSEFISLFRKEMRQARDQEARATRFVQSSAVAARTDVADVEAARAQVLFPPLQDDNDIEQGDDDYDYWPDFGLGIAQDDGQAALSMSTTSTTEGSTSELAEDDSQDDSQGELWPIELVVGS